MNPPTRKNAPRTRCWKRSLLLLCLGLLTSVGAMAGSIIDNAPVVKRYFDSNPSKIAAAIRLTEPNMWAKCSNVYLAMMAMEVRGKQWDDTTALVFSALGEAMGRVRLNFLSRGYPSATMDSLLKSYSMKPVDVPEMQSCNDLTNSILE